MPGLRSHGENARDASYKRSCLQPLTLCAGPLGKPISASAQNSDRDLKQLIKQATRVANDMKADRRLESLAKTAKAILIVPTISKDGQTVMLLMTQKAVEDFSRADNFSLGASAGLIVVDYAARRQGPVGKTDVVIWSRKSALFAGPDVNAARITLNAQEDASFYGRHASKRDILQGDVSQKKAAGKLRAALPV